MFIAVTLPQAVHVTAPVVQGLLTFAQAGHHREIAME
jgi:hypothetical protein